MSGETNAKEGTASSSSAFASHLPAPSHWRPRTPAKERGEHHADRMYHGKPLNPVTRTAVTQVGDRLCRAGVRRYVSPGESFTHGHLKQGQRIPTRHWRALERQMTSGITSTHLTFCLEKKQSTVHDTNEWGQADGQSAVPAPEESAQHPPCTLVAWDKDAQTLVHPQHGTGLCFQLN